MIIFLLISSLIQNPPFHLFNNFCIFVSVVWFSSCRFKHLLLSLLYSILFVCLCFLTLLTYLLRYLISNSRSSLPLFFLLPLCSTQRDSRLYVNFMAFYDAKLLYKFVAAQGRFENDYST